jgi:hypothetical protein
MTAPRWDRDTPARTDLQRALVTRTAANPLVAAWRWRYEIVLVSGSAAGLTAAIISLGAVPTIAAVIVMTLTILCWPTARQLAVDRAWCVITPHRVRVGCVEGQIYSSRGKIPVVMLTSHKAFGERVLLWCRAGISADDFVAAHGVLAAACWAQDVAIFFDVHRPQLVTLDVIRRPPSDPSGDLEGHRTFDPPAGSTAWPSDRDM